jgi:hypothetical protein
MATPNILALPNGQSVPALLVSTKIAVTTDSAVYTVAAAHAVKLAQGTIANISGSACTVGLSLVPSGGTVGDGTHKVIPDTYSLAAGDTLPLKDFLQDHVLGDGDIIAIHAGTANALDVVISGYVMS